MILESKYEFKEAWHKYRQSPYNRETAKALLRSEMLEELDFQILKDIISNHLLSEFELSELLVNIINLEEDTQKIVAIHEIILKENYYVQIAKQFATILLKQAQNKSIKPKQGEIHFERLMSIFCFDLFNSHFLFEHYRQFIVQAYSNEPTQKIRSIFERQIRIRFDDQIIQDYQGWEQDKKKFELTSQQMLVLKEQQKDLFNLEEKLVKYFQLNRQQDMMKILQDLHQLYQLQKLDLMRLLNYFEFCLYQIKDDELKEPIWEELLDIVSKQDNINLKQKYFRRASKSLKPNLAHYIKFIRYTSDITPEIERLLFNLSDDSDKIVLQMAAIQHETRSIVSVQNLQHIQKDNSNQINELEKGVIDNYIVNIKKIFKDIIDTNYGVGQGNVEELLIDTYIKYCRIEKQLFQSSSDDIAIIYEQALKRFPKSSELWMSYINQNRTVIQSRYQRDKQRGLYKRAVEQVKENITIIQEWMEFENLFGSVEELEKAEEKYLTAMQVEEEEEDGQSISVKKEINEVPPKNKQKVKKSQINDRVNENDDDKFKSEWRKPDPHVSSNQQPVIFIDKQNTLFVKNLPGDMTNEKLLDILHNKDQVKECRIVKDKNDRCKGFAYIDFCNVDELLKACDSFNKVKLNGQNIFAAQSQPPKTTKEDKMTLFLNNLPYSVSEQMIRDKLGQDVKEHIKEVRLIKGQDGKIKGYGYVEFSSQEALLEAKNSVENDPFIDGRHIVVDKADSLEIIKKKQLNQVLVMKNLPFKIKEEDRMTLEHIELPKYENGKPKGFAFVEFKYQTEFRQALEMNRQELKGRTIEIVKSDRPITRRKDEKFQMKHQSIIEQQVELSGTAQNRSNQDFKKLFQ